MKTRILSFVLAAVCLSVCSILCACDFVTPFAYTTFQPTDNCVMRFSSSMRGDHIWVFRSETDIPNPEDAKYIDNLAAWRRDCESACVIYISFNSILGSEDVDGTRYDLVNLKDSYYSVEVVIKKGANSLYSATKDLYLNGTKLEETNKYDKITDDSYAKTYYFEDFGLIRSNPGGRIDKSLVNTLEYK